MNQNQQNKKPLVSTNSIANKRETRQSKTDQKEQTNLERQATLNSKKRTFKEFINESAHSSKSKSQDQDLKSTQAEEEKKSDINDQLNIVKWTCSICYEDIPLIKAVLDCKHYFCTPCIKQWSTIETTCPICKKEFTKIVEKKLLAKKHKKRKPHIKRLLTANNDKKEAVNQLANLKIISPQLRGENTQVPPLKSEISIQPSDNEFSEEVNVIEVEKKKQRVNEAYIDVDLSEDDDDYGSYYDDDDDDSLLGNSDYVVYEIRFGQNMVPENIPINLLDDISIAALQNFVLTNLHARVDSWADVIILPDRMREALTDLHNGRLYKLNTIIRNMIIQKCKNYREVFNMTFPFISEEDLQPENNRQDFYVHVPALPERRRQAVPFMGFAYRNRPLVNEVNALQEEIQRFFGLRGQQDNNNNRQLGQANQPFDYAELLRGDQLNDSSSSEDSSFHPLGRPHANQQIMDHILRGNPDYSDVLEEVSESIPSQSSDDPVVSSEFYIQEHHEDIYDESEDDSYDPNNEDSQ